MKRLATMFPVIPGAMGSLLFAVAPPAAAQNPRLEFARGVLEASRGEKEAAARSFESALLLDPGALPLVDRVSAIRLDNGDVAGATRVWRDIAARKPDDARVQLSHVDFLKTAGRHDALAKQLRAAILEHLLSLNPADPPVIERLFQLRMESGDTESARSLLDGLPLHSAMLYASLARSAYDAGDARMLENIHSRFQGALELAPDDPALARAAAEHYRTNDRMEDAIAVLERHTRAAPWSLALRARLGVYQFAAKRDEAGRATLEELLEIHPRHVLAHQSLAKFHRLRGNHAEELHHSSELLKIRGGSPSDFLDLAGKWLDAERPREARLLLEKAVFDHPENASLARSHAIACRRDPETRKSSSRLFREAAELDAENPEPDFLIEAAEASLEEGQSKQAEDHLRAAIRAYPPEAKKQTAAAMRRLADLWVSENRNPGPAEALRQRARALDPAP